MKTLIIADDEPITRMDIRQMVEENGYNVLGEATDGFDAIELCRLNHPDILLMDIKMPLFDGLEAAKHILENDLAGCVVMLTAYSDQDLIERAGQVGVTGYIVKPIDQRRLFPTIEIAIAQSKKIKQVQIEAEKAKKRLSDSRIIDHAKSIIASEMGISEAQAFRELQSMSMSKHCTMASLATKIVEGKSKLTEVRSAKMLMMDHFRLSEAAAYRRLSTRAKQENRSVQEIACLVLEELKELQNKED